MLESDEKPGYAVCRHVPGCPWLVGQLCWFFWKAGEEEEGPSWSGQFSEAAVGEGEE